MKEYAHRKTGLDPRGGRENAQHVELIGNHEVRFPHTLPASCSIAPPATLFCSIKPV